MIAVFLAQWRHDRRSPALILIFMAISIAAMLLFSSNMSGQLEYAAFPDRGVSHDEAKQRVARMNDSGHLTFKLTNEEKALRDVREGQTPLAVRLMQDEEFRIVATKEGIHQSMVSEHMHRIASEDGRLAHAASLVGSGNTVRTNFESFMTSPPVHKVVLRPDGRAMAGNEMSIQLLLGFTLFLAMFTIGYKINAVMNEKALGIWNRVILSPVTKTGMYMGHLCYSLIIGLIHMITVLFVFVFAFGYDLGNQYGLMLFIMVLYSAAIVSLSMLLAGIVRTPEQFQMLLPVILPIMPLLAGIYFPPGLMTNKLLLIAGEFLPITHAVNALKQLALYDAGWSDIFMPVAKLALIGVICMGIGINLVERRKA
ncbi:ABC transporter permease [Paenibacillus paeoniae]|nr:ABC transporter permease [Paenibacillus paeoniae]